MEKSLNFDEIIDTFKKSNNSDDRYASFDYCFNWFQDHKNSIAKEDKLETSCLHLMSYLASWGMLRGSSTLLQKSVKFYEPLIRLIAGETITPKEEYIKGINQKIWEIDVDLYTEENIEILIDTYEKIKKCLYGEKNTRHIVAVTKIMLGVFGSIPAFDRYFCETFSKLYQKKGFAQPDTLEKKHLECIYEFYKENSQSINKQEIETKHFSANTTIRYYTKAKIIDMYGFKKAELKEIKIL